VLGSGFKVCFVGIAFGLLLSFFAMRLITSIFYGVAPTDLWIFSAGSLPVSALSHLANYIPVHCAARIDLMIALRYE
jgi:ABC-type antimicrobial peptide transport system permease subunit